MRIMRKKCAAPFNTLYNIHNTSFTLTFKAFFKLGLFGFSRISPYPSQIYHLSPWLLALKMIYHTSVVLVKNRMPFKMENYESLH